MLGHGLARAGCKKTIVGGAYVPNTASGTTASAKFNQTFKRNDRNLKSGLATGVDIRSVSVALLPLNGRWYQLSVHHTLEWRLI